MIKPNYDIFGIGNAVVDIEYRVDDTFLRKHQIEKHRMTLVDQPRLLALLSKLNFAPVSRNCGGSVANSLWAMNGFGSSAFFNCRVAPDTAGHFFTTTLEEAGIGTNAVGSDLEYVTGQCLILITPDAERTMNTCLGISDLLSIEQLEEDALRASEGIFMEGYLASSPSGSAAAIKAREIADSEGIETNLTISDTNMVTGFRPQLEGMIGDGITRVFANIDEASAWCKTDRLDVCLTELKDVAEEVIITLGRRGCAIRYQNNQFELPSVGVQPVDTNGAGDMFAGAYLSALIVDPNAERDEVGSFANFAASRVITSESARLGSPEDYEKVQSSYLSPIQTESVN